MTRYQTRLETGLVALDHNEGPPVNTTLRDAWAGIDLEAIRGYRSAERLERMLADRFAIDPARVLVTAGGDEAIDRCSRLVLGPGRVLLIAEPTFDMFGLYADQAHATVVPLEWPAGPFPARAMREAATQLRTRASMVPIVSPNNPTGETADGDALVDMARVVPDALVVVDHAYIEYGGDDLTALALAIPNAVVIRTFSKAWGLAGCRVGYVLGSRAVIDRLRSIGGPYPVSSPSLAMAEFMLERGLDRLRETIETTRAERETLQALIARSRCAYRGSAANFVVFKPPRPAHELRESMAARGFAIRTLYGALDGWVRITMPCDAGHFDRLRRALGELLGESKGGER